MIPEGQKFRSAIHPVCFVFPHSCTGHYRYSPPTTTFDPFRPLGPVKHLPPAAFPCLPFAFAFAASLCASQPASQPASHCFCWRPVHIFFSSTHPHIIHHKHPQHHNLHLLESSQLTTSNIHLVEIIQVSPPSVVWMLLARPCCTSAAERAGGERRSQSRPRASLRIEWRGTVLGSCARSVVQHSVPHI